MNNNYNWKHKLKPVIFFINSMNQFELYLIRLGRRLLHYNEKQRHLMMLYEIQALKHRKT